MSKPVFIKPSPFRSSPKRQKQENKFNKKRAPKPKEEPKEGSVVLDLLKVKKIRQNKSILSDLKENGRLIRMEQMKKLTTYGRELESAEDFNEVFKFRVRQARMSVNMTQLEVAKGLGISKQRYEKWERGKRGMISVFLLGKFAHITNTSVFDLLRHYATASEIADMEELELYLKEKRNK